MQCTSPFLLKMDNGDIIEVPCGKCASCIISRQREWALRMMNELEYHEYSVFVTLTFREAPYQISKRDLQLFLKRLRKELYPRKIKYYACGEYGEKYDRPHYHCILFGVSGFGADKDVIERAWPDGFIYTGSVTYESCRYVAKYIQKKYGAEFKEWLADRQPPFQLQSQGIGKKFAFDNKDRIKEELKIPYQGVVHGVPRYYKKKLEIDKESYKGVTLEKRRETFEELAKRCGKDDLVSIYHELRKARLQADRNVRARTGMKKDKL